MTQVASARAAWMQLWMVNPAGLISYGQSMTLLPPRSIFTSVEALISSNSRP